MGKLSARGCLIWIFILLLAIVIYLALAALDARFQACDTPRSQVYRIPLTDSDAALYIQSPRSLTFDGTRQQGRIELTIKSADNISATSPTLSTHARTSQAISPLPRFLLSCWEEIGVASVSLSTPSAALAVPDGDGADQSVTDSTKQEWSFQISSGEGVLLISSDGISYTPLITLSLSSDIATASFLVEHAALTATPPYASISLQNLNDRQFYANVATIELESHWELYFRKFLGIGLSLGSIFALIALGFAYLIQEHADQKDQDERARAEQKERDEQARIEQKERDERARTEQKERDEQARAEQKERDERERKEKELQQIVDRFASAQPMKIPTLVRDWVQCAVNLSKPPVHLRSQLKTVRKQIQLLIRNDVTRLVGDETDWVKEVHEFTQDSMDDVLDLEDVQLLKDIHFVASTLAQNGTDGTSITTHSFTDAYLLGVYLNYAWDKMQEEVRKQQLDALRNLTGQASADPQIEILWGIYSCAMCIKMGASSSLHDDLGQCYVNLDIPTDGSSTKSVQSKEPQPDDVQEEQNVEEKQKEDSLPEQYARVFSDIIAQIAGGTVNGVDRGLLEWCQHLLAERGRRESQKQQKWRIRQPLWPIPGNDVKKDDANYDYQPPPDKPPEDEAEQADESAKEEPPYWDSIFEELNQPYHHYVQGAKGSGKSWLRIYFETTIWDGYSSHLPVFYFPPLGLLYDVENRAFLYRSFAQSIANSLVAALLESYALEEREIHGIAPFLARYNYSVPLGEASLAIPASGVADLDRYYANRPQSYRLARIREVMQQAQKRELPAVTTPAQILRHIQTAVEEAGSSRVYLLIDNFSEKDEKTIWPALQSPEISSELSHYNIYLKMFGVTPPSSPGWPEVLSVDKPITAAQLRVFRQQASSPA